MDKQSNLKLEDVYDWFRDRQPYNPKLTWKDKIKVFFGHHWSNVRIFYFSIINGIENILYYLPVIWKDRDWDYEFTLDLLKAKLIKQREYFKKSNLVVETPKIVKQINDTIGAIEDFENFYEVCERVSQDELMKIKNTKNNQNQEPLVQNFFLKAENIKQNRWCKIFDTMKDNMQGWWD